MFLHSFTYGDILNFAVNDEGFKNLEATALSDVQSAKSQRWLYRYSFLQRKTIKFANKLSFGKHTTAIDIARNFDTISAQTEQNASLFYDNSYLFTLKRAASFNFQGANKSFRHFNNFAEIRQTPIVTKSASDNLHHEFVNLANVASSLRAPAYSLSKNSFSGTPNVSAAQGNFELATTRDLLLTQTDVTNLNSSLISNSLNDFTQSASSVAERHVSFLLSQDNACPQVLDFLSDATAVNELAEFLALSESDSLFTAGSDLARLINLI